MLVGTNAEELAEQQARAANSGQGEAASITCLLIVRGNIHHLHGASQQSSPPKAAYMDVSVSRHPRACKFTAPASRILGSQKTKSSEKMACLTGINSPPPRGSVFRTPHAHAAARANIGGTCVLQNTSGPITYTGNKVSSYLVHWFTSIV